MYNSNALAAIHETASDLRDAGLMDKQTTKTFDKMCLTPLADLSPAEIKTIRARASEANNKA